MKLKVRDDQNDGADVAVSTQTSAHSTGGPGWGRLILLGLAMVLVGGHLVRRGNGLRKDELFCEEAVVHLQECCKQGTVAVRNCDYKDGCDFVTYPSLNPVESECIRETNCAELVENGVCWLFTGKGPRGDYAEEFEEPSPDTFADNSRTTDRLGVCQ